MIASRGRISEVSEIGAQKFVPLGQIKDVCNHYQDAWLDGVNKLSSAQHLNISLISIVICVR